ncbi:ABC transporter permease [Histidinibacterium aquaticum]|uniref:Sugar ABC transporter permease n=1 Tax=Histidinibacterium aquaticum TaxID=2613962 RepID=A0A5J5GAE2_9RHOB|nr:ABC transporter permease [Histidinibacterium aquaticum]KAA9005095.1 sugar ABC transporter permease [Histidinibacterium aquaticum]
MTEISPSDLAPAQSSVRPPQSPQVRRSPLRNITALILREMTSSYGRTPGGYIWALAEPLGMIFILSLAFSLVMRTPSLGNSFILFYATGVLAFGYYGKINNTTMRSLKFSKSLLAYPVVRWIDAVLARLVLNTLTQLMIACLVLSGILIFVDTQAVIDFGPVLTAYIMAGLLGLGIGMINCVFGSFVPIWTTVWGILNRPLFLASGVIYIYEDLPSSAQAILWWNPLIHVTGLARSGFYPMYDATYVSYSYVLGLGLSLTAFGLVLMARYHKAVLER